VLEVAIVLQSCWYGKAVLGLHASAGHFPTQNSMFTKSAKNSLVEKGTD
jgi:hypothetical protein